MNKILNALVVLALSAGTAWAVTPEQRCEGGKSELGAKYALCRAKADKKLALSGDSAARAEAIAKCDAKYAAGWAKLEAKAADAGGTCVDVVPADDLREFVSACTDVVAETAAGGALPADVVHLQR